MDSFVKDLAANHPTVVQMNQRDVQRQQYAAKIYSEGKLTAGQCEIMKLCKRYLFDGDSSIMPSIMLVTGAAGTGKSTVVHHINEMAHIANANVINTSFNAINALNMTGPSSSTMGRTTCSLVNMNGQQKKANFLNLTPSQLEKLCQLTGLSSEGTGLGLNFLIIDEISNQAPWHLAKLSHAFQQSTGRYEMPFGGIPVMMTGDLGQMPPVKAGRSLWNTQKSNMV